MVQETTRFFKNKGGYYQEYIGRTKVLTYGTFLVLIKTLCGVAEYRKVQLTWPGQRSILYPVLKLYYFNVPEE